MLDLAQCVDRQPPTWRNLLWRDLVCALDLPPTPPELLNIRAIALFCALSDHAYEVDLVSWSVVSLCRLGPLQNILLLSRDRFSCNVHGEGLSNILDGRYGVCPSDFQANRQANHARADSWRRLTLSTHPAQVGLVEAALEHLILDRDKDGSWRGNRSRRL